MSLHTEFDNPSKQQSSRIKKHSKFEKNASVPMILTPCCDRINIPPSQNSCDVPSIIITSSENKIEKILSFDSDVTENSIVASKELTPEKKEALYVEARRRLHKINRMSINSFPKLRTPSKGGVIVECGKFHEIKAHFDQEQFNSGSAENSAKCNTYSMITKKFDNTLETEDKLQHNKNETFVTEN